MARGRSSFGRWLLGVGLVALALLLVAAAVLWERRETIATDLIARELRRRGVPARFRVVAIGPRTARLADLVVGDSGHPDLSVPDATVHLALGLDGVHLSRVEATGVRLRGEEVDGRMHFGALDRLLPAPRPGAAFALPSVDVTLHDARVRLRTTSGLIGLAIEGSGPLDSGFAGRAAIVSDALALGSCRADTVSAVLHVATERSVPYVDGPVQADRLQCGSSTLVGPAAELDARFTPALDGWRGGARLSADRLLAPGLALDSVSGQVGFAGDRSATRGGIDAVSGRVAVAGAEADTGGFSGRFTTSAAGLTGDGQVSLGGARADAATRRRLLGLGESLGSTPLAPIAQALVRAAAALTRVDASASLALSAASTGPVLLVTRPEARSASGAVLSATPRARLVLAHGDLSASGGLRLAGGGLPEIDVAAAGPEAWRVTVAPIEAGTARLVLAPTLLRVEPGGVLTAATRIRLDGPLPGGRVTGLTAPLTARADRGGVTLGLGCTPIGWEGLVLSSLVLDHGGLTLCPRGGAGLVTIRGGRVGGVAVIAPARLAGALGGTPLAVSTAGGTFDIGEIGFRLKEVAATLGPGEGTARLRLDGLDGRLAGGGLAGHVTGAAARLAAVPLDLRDATAAWTLNGGRLDVAGLAGRVADASAPARFHPLSLVAFGARLADGIITASGSLAEPRSHATVATVTIRHALATQAGNAALHVAGLRFGPALQPDALTPLTVGVVADVAGTITGDAAIRWSAAGVTSRGVFHTDRLDLAAAFGPVAGLAGTIRFDDLLGFHTPPGQVVTIASLNPGVEVTGGTIRYQLLGPTLIEVEGGEWPFAGGSLTLEPARLDFATGATRRFTLKVDGLDAARFIQQMQLDNIAATGTFDGTLPLVFDAAGGRIDGGRLVARPGGGTLSYVGEVSNAQLGTFGKLAFDALKSLRYHSLAIDLDGALDGEVVSRIGVTGINQQPVGAGRLGKGFTGLPFRFNITVRAPFRGLMNSARSFSDPSLLLHGGNGGDVQPPASAPGAGSSPR